MSRWFYYENKTWVYCQPWITIINIMNMIYIRPHIVRAVLFSANSVKLSVKRYSLHWVIFSVVCWRNGNTCGKNTSEKKLKDSRLNIAHKQSRKVSPHYGALTLELYLFCNDDTFLLQFKIYGKIDTDYNIA